MYYAQVKNQTVLNVIVANNLQLAQSLSPDCDAVIDVTNISPMPSPGWNYINEVFTPPVFPFPHLSPRQVRLGLVLSGISLETIEGAINMLPEPDRALAKISWEYAVEYERENPIVNSLSLLLGMTPSQVDELWQFASTL